MALPIRLMVVRLRASALMLGQERELDTALEPRRAFPMEPLNIDSHNNSHLTGEG